MSREIKVAFDAFKKDKLVRDASHDLLEALELFVDEYVELVNSGDAGFWDPEKEDKVKKARAAISKATQE